MKRIILWLSILLITFALGVTTAFFWFVNSTATSKKNEVTIPIVSKDNNLDEMPILAYCELANNPEKYDGKVVRVTAKLWQFIHGLKFLDKNCYAIEKESAVIFNAEREDEIVAKLTKETNSKELGFWGTPQIIAVGKFSRVKPTRKSDSMADNAFLQFEILEVEKASEQ